MKNEKLERLKKVLSGTEFEVEATSIYSALISLKDIWEGVEFVECTNHKLPNFEKGKVYRLVPEKNIDGLRCIYNEDGNAGSAYGKGGTKKNFKPSTEEAYVNQLKAKSFKLYGDIQDQDKFREPHGNTDTYREKGNKSNPEWDYIKHHDELFFYSILLYKEGKWAKKLPKRIEVSILNIILKDNYQAFEKCKSIGKEAIFDYMSKQLEKLLNDEVD